MAKKIRKNLEDLSREELLAICNVYKVGLSVANEKLKSKSRELEIIKVVLSQRNIPSKVKVCMDETIAYIKEIEKLKIKELRKSE